MEKNKESESITREAVWDVLKFAQSLYSPTPQGYNNFYTPDLLTQNLIGLNNNPLIPTSDKIKDALSSAVASAKTLRGYSEWMEYWDAIYSKVINYYASLLSFNVVPVCINAVGKDWNSKEYKDDLRRIHKFMDSFEYQDEFRKMVKEMLRRQTVFTWFRDSHGTFDDEAIDLEYSVKRDSKYALQTMPQDYCQLTGYFSGGLLGAMDMSYFLQPASDILLFDPSLKDRWDDVFNFKNHTIKPSAPLDKINGTFALKAMLSPENGSWIFKFDTSNFNGVPPMAYLLKSTFLNDEIQALQKDKDIISAYALVVGEMRMFDNVKAGTTPNQFSVTPEVMGQFLQLVQSGLKKQIRPISLPTENTKFMQYEDKNPNMYTTQVQNSVSQGVSASRVIYNTDKMSQEEIRVAITNDCNFMGKLYSQFNNFMNFFANKKTRKFKFKFEFEGYNFDFLKDYNFDRLKEAASVGLVVSEAKWGAALGIQPQTFHRMLEEVKYSKFADNLTLLPNANTTAQVDNKGGRPIKKEVNGGSRDYDN